MGLVEGKKILVMGIANEKSIAWSIAQKLKAEGAEMCFTYPNEALESRVRPLAEKLGVKLVLPCDVTKDEEVDKLFASIKKEWGYIDNLVHAVAFANKDELKGEFINTSREGFRLALDVSAYSLVSVCRGAMPLMEGRPDASVVTMSYYGAVKVITNYNVMGVAKAALEACVRYLSVDMGKRGIRVNAVSAGPIKTLAASGISGFKQILEIVENRAPLGRNVTQEDVAGATLYFVSNLSSGVSGEVHYVDSGFNATGL